MTERQPQTHLRMNTTLSGLPVRLEEDAATLELLAVDAMAADETGLVHGGFIFSLADYAAMLAINHPNAVLGAAQTRFLRPVRVGERVIAEARVDRREGKKIFVRVEVEDDEGKVFEGEFTCFTPPRHVLS